MESPDFDWTPSPLQLAMAARSRSSAPPTVLREDCWSEEATCTLLEEWGHRFLTANRKSLRQHLWQQVADAVNRRHGSSRTDLQCKNRVDTLKKRYKVEKARVLRSRNNTYLSPWPFFSALATLIGDHFPPKTSSCPSPPPSTASKTPSFTLVSVPVRPRSQKRFAMQHPPDPLLPHAAAAAGKILLRRHIRPVVSGSDSEVSRSLSDGKKRSGCGSERGYEKLANALKGLVEVYERVEMWKHRELVEMEKQRMQFLDELEKERIRWFQEMQAHLRNNKKPKLTSMAG